MTSTQFQEYEVYDPSSQPNSSNLDVYKQHLGGLECHRV